MILNYIYWDPSAEIFTIPGINWPVRWYGLMWALAFIASHFFMNRVFKAEGRSQKALDTLTLYIILGTVIGARLGHFLFYEPDLLLHDPGQWFVTLITPPFGGLASHGGAIGIIIAMVLYCRKTKESWLWLFDRLVIVVPLAGMCIRLGNLINSEIIGNVTNVPWAFIFVQEDNQPRHPAQLYEAIFCFFLFLFMYWFWKNKRNTVGPGFMFGLFCVVLWLERFIDEFFKENQVAFEDSMSLNMGQWLSIPFIIIGAVMIFRSRRMAPNSYHTKAE